MKKTEVIWIDGFNYTKKEYNKYFPNGHGTRNAIYRTVYEDTFTEKLGRIVKKIVRKIAYYGLLTILFVALFYVTYRTGHAALFHR